MQGTPFCLSSCCLGHNRALNNPRRLPCLGLFSSLCGGVQSTAGWSLLRVPAVPVDWWEVPNCGSMFASQSQNPGAYLQICSISGNRGLRGALNQLCSKAVLPSKVGPMFCFVLRKPRKIIFENGKISLNIILTNLASWNCEQHCEYR